MHALVVMSNAGPLAAERKQVVRFALEQRWPVIGGTGWAEDGALLSYGADLSAVYRRGASFAARILKGAKPEELPIERAMTFELVLNLKTAKALDLVIPHEFGARVDRVIK
jgi:putative ABC transport system substrate-binding protein